MPAIKGINQRRAKLLINELENKPQVRLEYWNSKREAEEKVEPRYPRTPGIIKKFGDFYGAGSVINMTIRLPKSAAELHAMLVRPDLGDAVERRTSPPIARGACEDGSIRPRGAGSSPRHDH